MQRRSQMETKTWKEPLWPEVVNTQQQDQANQIRKILFKQSFLIQLPCVSSSMFCFWTSWQDGIICIKTSNLTLSKCFSAFGGDFFFSIWFMPFKSYLFLFVLGKLIKDYHDFLFKDVERVILCQTLKVDQQSHDSNIWSFYVFGRVIRIWLNAVSRDLPHFSFTEARRCK